jgi:hypothetical protein
VRATVIRKITPQSGTDYGHIRENLSGQLSFYKNSLTMIRETMIPSLEETVNLRSQVNPRGSIWQDVDASQLPLQTPLG